jgi:hypothetical protein
MHVFIEAIQGYFTFHFFNLRMSVTVRVSNTKSVATNVPTGAVLLSFASPMPLLNVRRSFISQHYTYLSHGRTRGLQSKGERNVIGLSGQRRDKSGSANFGLKTFVIKDLQ